MSYHCTHREDIDALSVFVLCFWEEAIRRDVNKRLLFMCICVFACSAATANAVAK